MAVMASDVKDTNPKDGVGTKKVPLSVVPMRVLGEVGLALLEGDRKYGRFNWRVAGVRTSVYFDAVVMRHLGAFMEGQDIDPASGIHHISKAIAGLVVLRDSIMHGNCVDDRPPASDPTWVDEQNAKAAAIIEKYPSGVPPYTQARLAAEAAAASTNREQIVDPAEDPKDERGPNQGHDAG